MKENFIHVCFVIDSSGSMCGSEADVIGGFKRIIEEQKANTDGSCAITLIDFNSEAEVVFKGKDVNDIDSNLDYAVGGGTALFDAVKLGIDVTHEWNQSLDNAERPEKTMIVIMTDGGENCSRVISGATLRDNIKEMETEFGWSFVYLGADLTNVNDANTLGIKSRGVSTKGAMMSNYDLINTSLECFRSATGTTEQKEYTMASCLSAGLDTLNSQYMADTGIDINQ